MTRQLISEQTKNLKNGLTSIADIIKACKDSGVSSLKWGDLSIEFSHPVDKELEWKENASSTNDKQDGGFTDVALDTDYLDELKIVDPVRWEEIVHKEA